jgi:rod shape determining protein RodA
MWLIDRRYLHSFDWISFIVMLLLSLIGLLFVFSATYKPEVPFSLFFKKQLFGVLSGLCIYAYCCLLDYRTLERYGYFLYFATMGLLAFTLIKGSIGMGAQRWINLGFIKFQPSELAKLFFPAFFSYYLYTEKDILSLSITEFMPILGILGFSFLLIAKQPDLGTALLILFSGSTLLWLTGINKKYFLWALACAALTAPILFKCLKPYQRQRIEVFFGAGDKKKERYQLEQSRIAIGSGGLWGKGFLNGTQNKLMFLPESRTDCIFAVVCEECGFLGALILILLYSILFIRSFYVISTIKNFFAQLLASGLIIHIMFSAIINMSMVMGLMPIVGIPLPFLSYGISHLWITFASLGWLNSIAMRRFYLSMSATS